ncbi:MAG TPA: tetratricopeptide repeat protein [bacterium]|nr:tetratricopeptide repeat protein [bacterium]HPQ66463.1 tetratricopeptide repeat protein [bacterium]
MKIVPIVAAVALGAVGTPGGGAPTPPLETYLSYEGNLPRWWSAAQAGWRCWEEGKEAEAVARWEAAQEDGFQESRAFFRMGIHYYEAGEWERAAVYLARSRPWVEAESGDPVLKLRLYRSLGRALAELGRIDEAMINYRRALALDPADTAARVGLAGLCLRRGMIGAAESEADKVLENDPGNARALLIMARAAEQDGGYSRAAGIYRRILAADPAADDARLALGRILYYRLADPASARKELKEYLLRRPDDPSALAVLAEADLVLGDREAAGEAAARAVALDPRSYRGLVILGQLAFGKGEYSTAREFYRRAWESDRSLAPAEYGLGMVALQEGKLVEAEQFLRRACAHAPGFADAEYNLGVVFERGGRTEEAEGVFRKLVSEQPGYFPGHLAMGGLLYNQRRIKDALPFFLNAAALDRNRWEPYYYVGKCLIDQGRYRPALEALESAARIAPGNASVLTDIGVARQRLGDLDAAREAFASALEIEPDSIRARIDLALLEQEASRPGRAREEYRRALIVRPGDVRWGYEYEPGDMLRELSEGLSRHLATGVDYISLFGLIENVSRDDPAFPEMVPLLEKLLVEHPREPGYPYLIGLCFQRMNDASRAEHYFSRALQIDLDFAPAHLSLGRMYLLQERFPEARAHLEAFVALVPRGEASDAARVLLESLPDGGS